MDALIHIYTYGISAFFGLWIGLSDNKSFWSDVLIGTIFGLLWPALTLWACYSLARRKVGA